MWVAMCRDLKEFSGIPARQVRHLLQPALTPQDCARHGRYVAHVNVAEDDRPALFDRLQGEWNKRAYRRPTSRLRKQLRSGNIYSSQLALP